MNSYVVLVCGGRDFRDRSAVFRALDRAHASRRITRIIEGGQRRRERVSGRLETVGGADWWANRWASERGVECKTVAADWHRFGTSAGPRRNQIMADMVPHLVIAFPGGVGTRDMVTRAVLAGIVVQHVIASEIAA